MAKNWFWQRSADHVRCSETAWQQMFANAPVLAKLDAEERERLCALSNLFLHQKAFEAAGELLLDETMRLRIAAEACLLILNLGLSYYRNVRSVIVYPGGFIARHRHTDAAGVVHEELRALSGEAWQRGPVIIAWDRVLQSSRGGGNVVIHEFAHKLDGLNGVTNGFPPLGKNQSAAEWSRVFSAAYDGFCERLARAEALPLDAYAAENPAEFFAVTSEAFFVMPGPLQAHYPDVYRQLQGFYRQDPGSRQPAPRAEAS